MVSHLIWIILRGKIIFEENNLLRDGSSSDCNIDFSHLGSSIIPYDDIINSKIHILNTWQKIIFDAVHKWARNNVNLRLSKTEH